MAITTDNPQHEHRFDVRGLCACGLTNEAWRAQAEAPAGSTAAPAHSRVAPSGGDSGQGEPATAPPSQAAATTPPAQPKTGPVAEPAKVEPPKEPAKATTEPAKPEPKPAAKNPDTKK